MSVVWLQPAMWFGAALIALPVVIHLLTRHRARRVAFPTLKFIPAAQLVALRSRAISEWPLLAVRVLILLAAVAAAASPVFVSDARREFWQDRVARAIVFIGEETEETIQLASDEASTSFVSQRFSAERAPDALREAVSWLADQPPAAREVVVIGDLREGALIAADVDLVPSVVGIRFLPTTAQDDRVDYHWRTVGETHTGGPVVFDARVVPDEQRTSVEYDAAEGAPWPGIRVVGAPDHQAHADAVLRAVLREGVVLNGRRVAVMFSGAALPELQRVAAPTQDWMRRALAMNPHVRGGEVDGALVVAAEIPVTDDRAPSIVAGVVRAAFDEPRVNLEPRRLAAATLAAWSRPAGGLPADAQPGDEGDRRWFWGLALALLGLEHVMRRKRRAA